MENLVRESTNTDAWGPTTKQKKQLVTWIFNYQKGPHGGYFNDIDTSNIDPSSAHEISRYALDFIVKRIREYSIHIHGASIYEKVKKSLVTKGYEFLIITKCLSLIEYLLLNGYKIRNGRLVFDIVDDVKMHTSTFESLETYHVKLAYDGLVMVHEKQVHTMAARILKLLSDQEYLNSERAKLKPGEQKVEAQAPARDFFAEEKKTKDPLGRSRMSSISNTVGKIVTSPSHRRRRRRSVKLGNSTSYGSYNDDMSAYGHSYNANQPHIREVDEEYNHSSSNNQSDNIVHVPISPNLMDDDEFGSLQTPEEPVKNDKADPNKDLMDLLGLDMEGTSVANANTTNESANTTTKVTPAANSNATTTAGAAKAKHDDLFGDLLVDFKKK